MAVHDAFARLTPYEVLLPRPDFADERFPAIEAEAGARGTDLHNPAAFAMSGPVQGVLADLRPDDGESAAVAPAGAAPTASPLEDAHAHAEVLFFAFCMWRTMRLHDSPVVALAARRTLRSLLADGTSDDDPGTRGGRSCSIPGDRPAGDAPKPGWASALRDRAGYVQLPQHMVWAEEAGAERPESVDGFFWAASPDGAFHATAVTGMRQGRPGYGVIAAPPQRLDSLSSWTTAPAREGGDEFSTGLPGAELDGLVGIRTPAEILKLVALALERWAHLPESARSPAAQSCAPPSPASRQAHSPVPSTLPYVFL